MKVSENWLLEWVNPNWSTEKIAESLSLAGLEVDGVEPVAPAFSGVVVAEVKKFEKHPDADKLNVTQVDAGTGELIQIVCGAPNVEVGMRVPCAMVGAVLPGDFKIKNAKLRGVASSGMLCSGTELGLPQDYDGLLVLPADAPIGEDIRQYLQLNDHSIDVDLTPNRADCLSVEGLARELALISGAALQVPFELPTLPRFGACQQQVAIDDLSACPKYLGCIVEDYDSTATTPAWMLAKLERSGLRAISLTVDITNYVMLELGQPMHAFDADKLTGEIRVRYAQAGETIVTLDDKKLDLTEQTLLITDASGPIAVAGVIGGLEKSVDDNTKRLFFEAAHFAPLAIVGKARQYGLHTDSSHRFERGVDLNLPARAMDRAVQLLLEIAGGKVSEVVEVAAEQQASAKPVELRAARLNKLLGAEISADFVVGVLEKLGCQFETSNQGWLISPPSYRFDLQIEADFIEEVARIYGYNNLPASEIGMPLSLKPLPESKQEANLLKNALIQRGFYEVITYSFVPEKSLQTLTPDQQYVVLQNPISEEMKAMRTSLQPGLLMSWAYNQSRQQNRIKIFETGLVFETVAGELLQQPKIAGLIAGNATSYSWLVGDRQVDFYDLKGDVEALFAMSGKLADLRFEANAYHEFHPGQSAKILLQDQEVGRIGQLHPQYQKQFGIKGAAFLFELDLQALSTKPVPKAGIISKFPEVDRDLAFVVAEDLPVQQLFDAIKSVENQLLTKIELFDVYQGQGIEEGKKSLALNLKFQTPERTLQDEEIEQLVEQIIETTANQVGAKLR